MRKYNEQTLKNLAKLLFEDKVPWRYAQIMLRPVQEAIIPWGHENDVIGEAELKTYVCDAVFSVLQPYTGSNLGYSSHESRKWNLLAIVLGPRQADVLMSHQFEYKQPVWNGDQLELSGTKKTSHDIFYTEVMRDWVDYCLPKQLKALNEEARMDIGCSVFIVYGEHAMSLPRKEMPTDLTEIHAAFKAEVDNMFGANAFERFGAFNYPERSCALADLSKK